MKTPGRARAAVQTTVETDDSSFSLTLEKLHEAVEKIAVRQEELYRIVHSQGRADPQPGVTRRKTVKGNISYICYTCGEAESK